MSSAHASKRPLPLQHIQEHLRGAFLRLPDVKMLTGCSRATIYRRMAARRFPQQVALTDHMVVWLESEVRAWMAEQVRRCRAPG